MPKKYPASNKKEKTVVAIYMIVTLAFLSPIGVQPDKSKRDDNNKNDKTDFVLFMMHFLSFLASLRIYSPNPTPKPTLLSHFS